MRLTSASAAVEIPVEGVRLAGNLEGPAEARGLVLFAHGSGSSRLSPRNRQVAAALHESAMATLLFDLLTPSEEEDDARDGRHRFDIPALAGRLVAATDWVLARSDRAGLPVGYFGASTGGGAALVAAAARAGVVRAVVSRGGRPDLAAEALPQVAAPTLLIVGGNDSDVLRLNEQAFAGLRSPKELVQVPGAGHLFTEPGALDQVVALARDWFTLHLPRTG